MDTPDGKIGKRLLDLLSTLTPQRSQQLTQQAMGWWISHPQDAENLLSRMEDAVQLPVPQNGEIFELAINGTELDPLDVVRFCAFQNKKKIIIDPDWIFDGPSIPPGFQIQKFKLINQEVYCDDFHEIADLFDEKGLLLSAGYWVLPFLKRYPKRDNRGDIGFGGPGDYITQNNRKFFIPFLLSNKSEINWTIALCSKYRNSFPEGTRWLVEIK